MQKANQTRASIEGLELSVVGQDIKPSAPPINLPDTGEIVFPLTVKTRGQSEITIECNPKECKIREYSFLDLGSSISGQNLWGFSSNPLDSNSVRKGGKGKTSSHTGQYVVISGTCFMEIVQGYRGDPLLIHPKNTDLSITKD